MTFNKPIIYNLEQIRSFDTLSGYNDQINSMGAIVQTLLGDTGTYVANITATASVPASMVINFSSPGFILKYEAIDASAYGPLDPNTTQVMQIGSSIVTSLALTTAQLNPGQSQYVLIEGGFKQVDAIRVDDPNDGVLPYININNPLQPFAGENNSGVPQDTVRQGICDIALLPGTPATTGTEVPPSPTPGYVPLFLVDLAYGQTMITQEQILPTAGVSGSSPSPVLAGLLHSHHNGHLGQAPKIILDAGATQEVQGHLPTANMVASSAAGAVPCMYSGSGNPNGHVAGNNNVNGASDIYWDNIGKAFYVCSQTGSISTAQWTAVSASAGGGTTWNLVAFTSSGSYTPTANTKYIFVALVGGGGGGGGGQNNAFTGQSAAGGAGGAGAGGGAWAVIPAASLTLPVSVVVGAGGVPATSVAIGGAGGTTAFAGYLSASGGGGGYAGQPDSNGGLGGTGSIGGGVNGIATTGNSGASCGVDSGGSGGASILGGGGRGSGSNGIAFGAAVGWGGGGGGGGQANGGAPFLFGGYGGQGIVLILEYIGP